LFDFKYLILSRYSFSSKRHLFFVESDEKALKLSDNDVEFILEDQLKQKALIALDRAYKNIARSS
jgi:hypothetical protein